MGLGLDGRAVLVTGASRGMGRAIALAYGREHARVAVTDHEDEQAATDAVRELSAEGGEGCTVQLDLADPASPAPMPAGSPSPRTSPRGHLSRLAGEQEHHRCLPSRRRRHRLT